VPRQPGGKEPARKAAVCRAPTAQETAEMQPPEERSAAARRVQESGREREKWERRRRGAMLACCAIWAQIAGPSGWAELVPLLGLPALGSHHKIFFILRVSLGYFHLQSFNSIEGHVSVFIFITW